MSKTFKIHPAKATVGIYRPMAVELDPSIQNLGKYPKLSENPLYYYNALQYIGGSFYRKVLGYEILWDRRKEDELCLCLDYYLTHLIDRELYYHEEVKLVRDIRMHGVRWPRGIAPQTLSFDLQWAYELKAGESLTCRVNLIDKPNHVDIERANGEVFTLPFIRYIRFREKHCKVKGTQLNERKSTRTATKGPQSRARARYSVALRLISQDPAWSLSHAVYPLRQAFRGQDPLQKAPKRVQ